MNSGNKEKSLQMKGTEQEHAFTRIVFMTVENKFFNFFYRVNLDFLFLDQRVFLFWTKIIDFGPVAHPYPYSNFNKHFHSPFLVKNDFCHRYSKKKKKK